MLVLSTDESVGAVIPLRVVRLKCQTLSALCLVLGMLEKSVETV